MATQLQHLRSSLPSISTSQLPASLRNTPALAALGAISVLGLLRTLRALRRDYGTWKALGAGGLPHDVRGYLVNLLLRPLAVGDKTSIGLYAKMQVTSRLESTSYIGTSSGRDPAALPPRPGPRPTVSHHAAPSRQLDMKPSRALIENLAEQMRDLATRHPTSVTTADSVLERGGGPALFLPDHHRERTIWHQRSTIMPTEIAHLHLSDGSGHLFLSAKDAETVLAAGWGERHPLSGRSLLGKGLPKGFVMVYAPRDEKEIDTVLEIVKAAVRYATEGRADV